MPILVVVHLGRAIARFDWNGVSVILGRDPNADIDLSSLDDISISRTHARIECDKGKYVLRDIGAKNTTTVNGSIITRQELQDGDEIGIGSAVLIFACHESPQADVPEATAGLRPTAASPVPNTEIKTVVQLSRGQPSDMDSLRISHQRLLLVYELTRQFYASNDLNALMQAVVSAVCRVTGAERALATVSQQAQSEPTLSVGHNIVVGHNQKLWPVSHTILNRVLNGGDSVLADDAISDPAFHEVESIHRLQVRSVMCCPLKSGGKTIGLIYADSPVTAGVFNSSDLDLLRLLALHVEAAISMARSREEILARNLQLQRENQLLTQRKGVSGIVGDSEGIRQVMGRVHDIAQLPAEARITVLISGETGTGKELIAREIHASSSRRAGPMISVNCAAVAENLIEAEMFGIEAGVATGVAARKGLLEAASGGVVFLDEITEMSLSAQSKLLRAIQERSVLRVGGRKEVKVNAWVVAATNKDLQAEVEAGRFRKDLFYRLRVLEVRLLPLREREEDAKMLATFFVDRYSREFGKSLCGLDSEAMQAIAKYPWPGNVRELENAIAGGVAFCHGTSLKLSDLPPDIAGVPDSPDEPLASLEEMEKAYISKVLQATKWNISRAADILKLGRQAVYQKIEKYALKRMVECV